MKRRELMIKLGLAAVTIPTLGETSETKQGSGEMVPGADVETDLLFVQNSLSISLTNDVLRLKDVSASTLYFPGRPERLVGHWETADFDSNWGTGGEQTFNADPHYSSIHLAIP